MKIFLIILLSFWSIVGHTKTIQQLFTREFMTCRDVSAFSGEDSWKSKRYTDVLAYKVYKGHTSTQTDFAVDFFVKNLHVIKFSLKERHYKENKDGEMISSEGSIYYFVLKNSLKEVKKSLNLKEDNHLMIQTTPQGNTKLMCVIAG